MLPTHHDTLLKAHTFNAIDSATPERLRDMLYQICHQSRETLRHVAEELLLRRWEAEELNESKGFADESDVEAIEGGEMSDDSDESGFHSESDCDRKIGNGRKRKRPLFSNKQRFDICVQCEEEFDVYEQSQGRGNQECSWHDGILVINDASLIWADWDDRILGEQNTEENRHDYPEGFFWTCCALNGEAEGCQTGGHRPDTAKRRKAWSTAPGGDLVFDDL
ncbi:hypothetical protein BCR34DRAFT_478131 [Clohesyomyces aquaticus]|uniref:Uncharacterized protein n=1 Tax=Clohesyomyces aquaticus TaxID=1231657 RepID=A0A1Y1ZYK4_9PLEO|nr:hypothetical protein BCR34DRAFT_478131 [Clohesyomyces aquaticus]